MPSALCGVDAASAMSGASSTAAEEEEEDEEEGSAGVGKCTMAWARCDRG